ncbi:phosphoadenosine phosphosulfate reductase family protein [Burkholderia stabilis]|uniref:phosphoadenosine phosphosulfate reductase family protein n=1 Tax=Burkholderia stabilis TaxID=95485 RepID=UPI001F4A7D52|nr:phosphoadenosine phosphosulfate reductase family protein [Burkholderia stabilis]
MKAPTSLQVTVSPEVEQLLLAGAACAVGVSGGKDSQACALAVDAYLNRIDHTGPRVLIHADLGRVEWADSLPVCEKLAQHLGYELMVVRRQAGDMLARWQGRWTANLKRYRELSCVKLILPWSTPAMRFCTSELKTSVIASELKKRFPSTPVVNVTGVRREESTARSKMPVWAPMQKLQRRNLEGVSWNAIIDAPKGAVLDAIHEGGLVLHEAYTKYNTSRVSCVYCIMSSESDLRAAATCVDNAPLLREMVDLECESTFAFQGDKWLADVAPHLLTREMPERVEAAKVAAAKRRTAEARIPKHLLYVRGWPTLVPSIEEADLIASVRREVAAALGIDVQCVTGPEVRERYEALFCKHEASHSSGSGEDHTVEGLVQMDFEFDLTI